MHMVRNPLVAQLDRLKIHSRQGSFKTRERYYQAMGRACAFWWSEFKLQKLENLQGKHLTAYIKKLQGEGKAASTIKTELAAIRYFHDQLPNARYKLPDNDHLGIPLEKRTTGGVDRTWSKEEVARFLQLCIHYDHRDYAIITLLCETLGLRIHEAFRIDTAAVEGALRSGLLMVKGKGGKVRRVAVPPEVLAILREQKRRVPRGQKLFVEEGVETHRAIRRMEDFLDYHRQRVQDPGSTRPMTVHGLRHTYAARTFLALLEKGASPQEAKVVVSHNLGHNRPEIVNSYLSSVREK